MSGVRFILLCIAVLAASVLAGCNGERPPLVTASTHSVGPYYLDTGDELRIIVYDQQSLTNVYSVDQAGYIALPLIGAIAARGATTDILEQRIAAALSTRYVREPNVTVEVAGYRPFFVLGEVNNPGQYPYVPGMTAETAIAVAGGFTARANMHTVRVSRSINGRLHEGRIPVTQS
ncbi:MAG TPA: polysaccharide biosynthesis/export family protein, partial [Afifellaceae bacterium]|nr:polysaccharide biosynthesis/export family protein [Afifellaceae bacterium]